MQSMAEILLHVKSLSLLSCATNCIWPSRSLNFLIIDCECQVAVNIAKKNIHLCWLSKFRLNHQTYSIDHQQRGSSGLKSCLIYRSYLVIINEFYRLFNWRAFFSFAAILSHVCSVECIQFCLYGLSWKLTKPLLH